MIGDEPELLKRAMAWIGADVDGRMRLVAIVMSRLFFEYALVAVGAGEPFEAAGGGEAWDDMPRRSLADCCGCEGADGCC